MMLTEAKVHPTDMASFSAPALHQLSSVLVNYIT